MNMKIELAAPEDKPGIQRYDGHLPAERLDRCLAEGFVYVLRDGGEIRGILRYSLFWQTIPFLDLLFLDEACRGKGFGSRLLARWEEDMRQKGCRYVMTSTQADETAWQFYEKLGYVKIGSFLPPEQEAEEWMYLKML